MRRSLQQHGFTLIEILISAMLSLFLLAGMLKIYANHKDAFLLLDSMAQIQKNGRFAIDRITSKIQDSGYSGFYISLGVGVENTLNTSTDNRWDISMPRFGYNNVAANASIITGLDAFTAGSDVLLLKSIEQEVSLISHPTADTMILDAASGYKAGDLFVATDPNQASLFQISTADNTTVSGQTAVTIDTGTSIAPGNLSIVSNFFEHHVSVGKLESIIYFLKQGINGRSALFEGKLIGIELTIGGTTSYTTDIKMTELISNVEGMHFTYGLDTTNDGNIDLYTATPTSLQWEKVRNIGMCLLFSSENKLSRGIDNSYTFDDSRFTFVKDSIPSISADKRLRRVFTTYIALNNL